MLHHHHTLQIRSRNLVCIDSLGNIFLVIFSVSVVPCSLEDLQPLLEHLVMNKPGPGEDNQSIVFSRGAIMTGGRLDLCKQVVGPKGIQPLLEAMKCSSVVNRLLLGELPRIKKNKARIDLLLFYRK